MHIELEVLEDVAGYLLDKIKQDPHSLLQMSYEITTRRGKTLVSGIGKGYSRYAYLIEDYDLVIKIPYYYFSLKHDCFKTFGVRCNLVEAEANLDPRWEEIKIPMTGVVFCQGIPVVVQEFIPGYEPSVLPPYIRDINEFSENWLLYQDEFYLIDNGGG